MFTGHIVIPNQHNLSFPQIPTNQGESPTPNIPSGGMDNSLTHLAVNEPTRAFNNNVLVSMNRAQRTLSPDAMTADVYSAFWSRD